MTKEESKSRLNLILNEGENPYLLIDKIFDDFEKEKQELINKYSELSNKYTELKLKGKELTKEQFRQMAFPIVDGKNVILAKMELFPNNIGMINGNLYKIEIKEFEDLVILTKI